MATYLSEVLHIGRGHDPCVHFIVVPGFAGDSLANRTCPHFSSWLANIVNEYSNHGRSWVFDHDIHVSKLQSWDKYAETGECLLIKLLSMMKTLCLHDDDTLVLIGHKLGCYILKKALIDTCQGGHKPEEYRLLNMIQTILMIGEPNLHPSKPEEWIDLISECLSSKQRLSQKLADGFTVGCLQNISERFEDLSILSTMFAVCGARKPQQKYRVAFRKIAHEGCIYYPVIYVRMWTTQDEERILPISKGDPHACPFDVKSGQYLKLLTLNDMPKLPQLMAGNNTDDDSHHEEPQILQNKYANKVVDSESTVSDLELPGEPKILATELPTPDTNKLDITNGPTIGQMTHSITEGSQVEAVTEPSCDTTSVSTGSMSVLAAEMTSTDPIEDQLEVSAVTARVQRKPRYSTAAPARDDFFCGRDTFLHQIEKIVFARANCASIPLSFESSIPTFVWITGANGVGKTSIATEFAYRFAEKFDQIIWLHARSEATLGQSYHDAAVALGIVNGRVSQNHAVSQARLINWLITAEERWLLVLDDVGESIDITRHFPEAGSGSIIATSKYVQAEFTTACRYVELNVPSFTKLEAMALLSSTFRTNQTPASVRAIHRAASRCYTSPLGLRQLITWIQRENISLVDIEYLFAAKDVMLTFKDDPLLAVLSTNWRRLDRIHMAVLQVSSFLDVGNLQINFLLGAQPIEAPSSVPALLVEDAASIQKAARRLWECALFDRKEKEGAFTMHAAVGKHVRAALAKEAWREAFQVASTCVKRQWPPEKKLINITNGTWSDFDSIHGHVDHLAARYIESCSENMSLHDPGDDFKYLCLNHAWYNARRGNSLEDQRLGVLAHVLLSTSPADDITTPYRALPRRCLQVLEFPESTVRVVNTQGRHGEYVALSWTLSPTDPINSLTTSTLKNYSKRIEIATLPKAVRDAIFLTRNLGFRYIWIDKLCIVQDNPVEVADEFSRMLLYYKNAHLTIALGHVTQSDQTLNQIKTWSGSDGRNMVNIWPYHLYKHSGAEEHTTPFFGSGAWASEQQLLSIGTLYYKKDRPVLEKKQELSGRDRGRDTSRFHLDSDDGTGELSTVRDLLNNLIGSQRARRFTLSIVSALKEDSNLIEGRDDTSSSKNERSTTNLSSKQLSDARTKLSEGQSQLLSNGLAAAAGLLTLARDLLQLQLCASSECLESYALASALLATAYHLLGLDEIASGLATNAQELCMHLWPEKEQQSSYGRLLLSSAVVLSALGRTEQSKQKLEESRAILAGSDEQNEWTACIDIRLADIYASSNKIKDARDLLQSAMTYFQTQASSETIQGHLARIFFRLSLVWKQEGNTAMYCGLSAAANATLSDLQARSALSEGDGISSSKPNSIALTIEDYDRFVEPWHR